MLGPLLCAAAISLTYQFPADSTRYYDFKATFEGFVPVLGGQEGKVEVSMGVKVDGLAPDSQAPIRASSTITAFKLLFNGATIPLSVDSIQDYFPKTTIGIQSAGKLVKTDAPDKTLPVKLPGLDIKRFPDISYLPIELPDGSVDVGATWRFERQFGSTPLKYECKVTKIHGALVSIDVGVQQTYSVLEDEALEVVIDEKAAVRRVDTKLSGKGSVTFDASAGVATKVDMTALSVSQVVDLKTARTSERKLANTLAVRLRVPGQGGKVVASTSIPTRGSQSSWTQWAGSLVNSASNWVRGGIDQARSWVTLLQVAARAASNFVPGLPMGELPAWLRFDTFGGFRR